MQIKEQSMFCLFALCFSRLPLPKCAGGGVVQFSECIQTPVETHLKSRLRQFVEGHLRRCESRKQNPAQCNA